MSPKHSLPFAIVGCALTMTGLSTIAQAPPKLDNRVPNATKHSAAEEAFHMEAMLKARAAEGQYKGLVVRRGDYVEHPQRLVIDRAVAALEKQDFVPVARAVHFAWIAKYGSIVAWNAEVIQAKAVPGGLELAIQVHPTNTGGVTKINDRVVEYYRYQGGRLAFVGIEVSPGPQVIVID